MSEIQKALKKCEDSIIMKNATTNEYTHLKNLSFFFETILYDDTNQNFRELLNHLNLSLQNAEQSESYETCIENLYLLGECIYWRYMSGSTDHEEQEINHNAKSQSIHRMSKKFDVLNRRYTTIKFDQMAKNAEPYPSKPNTFEYFAINNKIDEKQRKLDDLYKKTSLLEEFINHDIKNTIQNILCGKEMIEFFKKTNIDQFGLKGVFCYMLLEYVEEVNKLTIKGSILERKLLIGFDENKRMKNLKGEMKIMNSKLSKFSDYKKNLIKSINEYEKHEKPYIIFCEIVSDIKKEFHNAAHNNYDNPSLKWMFEKIERLKNETYDDIIQSVNKYQWLKCLEQFTNYSWLNVRYVELKKQKAKNEQFDFNPNTDKTEEEDESQIQSPKSYKFSLSSSVNRRLNKILSKNIDPTNIACALLAETDDHINIQKIKKDLFSDTNVQTNLISINIDTVNVPKGVNKHQVVGLKDHLAGDKIGVIEKCCSTKKKKKPTENVVIANSIKVFGIRATLEKTVKSKNKVEDLGSENYDHKFIKPIIRNNNCEKFSDYILKKETIRENLGSTNECQIDLVKESNTFDFNQMNHTEIYEDKDKFTQKSSIDKNIHEKYKIETNLSKLDSHNVEIYNNQKNIKNLRGSDFLSSNQTRKENFTENIVHDHKLSKTHNSDSIKKTTIKVHSPGKHNHGELGDFGIEEEKSKQSVSLDCYLDNSNEIVDQSMNIPENDIDEGFTYSVTNHRQFQNKECINQGLKLPSNPSLDFDKNPDYLNNTSPQANEKKTESNSINRYGMDFNITDNIKNGDHGENPFSKKKTPIKTVHGITMDSRIATTDFINNQDPNYDFFNADSTKKLGTVAEENFNGSLNNFDEINDTKKDKNKDIFGISCESDTGLLKRLTTLNSQETNKKMLSGNFKNDKKNVQFVDEEEEWGADYVSAHEMNSQEYEDFKKESQIIDNDAKDIFGSLDSQSNFIFIK